MSANNQQQQQAAPAVVAPAASSEYLKRTCLICGCHTNQTINIYEPRSGPNIVQLIQAKFKFQVWIYLLKEILGWDTLSGSRALVLVKIDTGATRRMSHATFTTSFDDERRKFAAARARVCFWVKLGMNSSVGRAPRGGRGAQEKV